MWRRHETRCTWVPTRPIRLRLGHDRQRRTHGDKVSSRGFAKATPFTSFNLDQSTRGQWNNVENRTSSFLNPDALDRHFAK